MDIKAIITKSPILAGAASLPITLFLFAIMANLVQNGADLGKSSDSENFIDFLRTTNVRTAETKKRSLPEKPPEPKVQPKMPKMAVKSASKPSSPKMAMNTPALANPLAFGSGPYLGGGVGAGSSDSGVMPLVRIEPQYPRKAAMQGAEGWVQLKFDITETGAVTNVDIIKSNPKRLFDSAAKKALYKWKYRPKMVDGKPEKQENLMVQLDFKIQK